MCVQIFHMVNIDVPAAASVGPPPLDIQLQVAKQRAFPCFPWQYSQSIRVVDLPHRSKFYLVCKLVKDLLSHENLVCLQ